MADISIAEKELTHDLKWIESDFTFTPQYKAPVGELDLACLRLYRIDEITYEKDSPREEALSNVFTSVSIPGINVVYLLIGDKAGVRIYLGVVQDVGNEKLPDGLNMSVVGDDMLLMSLKGNFRGSTITPITGDELYEVYGKVFPSELELDTKLSYRTMDGVPGLTKDNETKSFQGMDRLIDAMQGDDFSLMILAKPIDCAGRQMDSIERNLDGIYRKLAWASKCQFQDSRNTSKNTGESISHGVSDGVSEAINNSKSQSDTSDWHDSKSTSSSSKSGGWSQQNGLSAGESLTANTGTSCQTTRQVGEQSGDNKSWGYEIVSKRMQGWLKYFDELIYPRLDRSKGSGMYVVSTLLASESLPVLTKLSNAMRAIYSGTEGNMVPFRDEPLTIDSAKWKSLASLRQPVWKSLSQCLDKQDNQNIKNQNIKNNREFAFARSKCAYNDLDEKEALGEKIEFYDGTWMSSSVLSHLAGLPQKEVIGVKLREEVEFGLNVEPKKAGEDVVSLGSLVQSGEPTKIDVLLRKSEFDRHIFVAGVTGSGKTTTCQQLLCNCVNGNDETHFLVIEPAKTEYRSLAADPKVLPEKFRNISDDLLVFTLGNEVNGAPFRLNPLEFSKGETISSRVDMLMASMEAAFDMEAAIPQILETAIYRAYEDYGWDKHTNQNRFYPEDKAFEPGVYAFPRLSDVVNNAVKCVGELFPGQDKRLHDEYVGSIRARLGGLLVGAKGQMLDCKRSMDFDDLLEHNVVLELEEIRNGQQKALIIGFILTNLIVAIKRKYDDTGRKIGHITLIEEAHRLMSRYQPGDDPNKRLAVETFSDMLAEVRKYGESIVIADQIPNKLTPDVLKNTNIKIVHRIFAQDDRDEIGATMSLTDDQKDFLPRLKVGHAVAFSGSWPKAVHVCVPLDIDTTKQPRVTNGDLRKRAFKFLADHYKSGVLPGFERVGSKKNAHDKINAYWNDIQTVDFSGVFENEILGMATARNQERREQVRRAIKSCGIEVVAAALVARYLPTDNAENRVAAAIKALCMFAKGESKFPAEVKRLLTTKPNQ